MKKFLRVGLPGLMIVLAMALSAWSSPARAFQGVTTPTGQAPSTQSAPSTMATPSATQLAQQQGQQPKEQSGEKSSYFVTQVDPAALVKNSTASSGNMTLNGSLAQVPGLQQRMSEISAFSVNWSTVNSAYISMYDKQFIEDSLTSNSLELVTMQYAVGKVKDPELKALIQMMIGMHSQDQMTLLKVAPQFGVDVSMVDFANASVYPETPAYDLGERTENLSEHYLDHLVERTDKSFDDTVLHILDQEHSDDVQSELAAERLVQNDVVKAFAKHAADVTGLHMKLLEMVSERVSQHFDEVNQPDLSAGYMSPMMITVNGQSSQGGQGLNGQNSQSGQSGSSK